MTTRGHASTTVLQAASRSEGARPKPPPPPGPPPPFPTPEQLSSPSHAVGGGSIPLSATPVPSLPRIDRPPRSLFSPVRDGHSGDSSAGAPVQSGPNAEEWGRTLAQSFRGFEMVQAAVEQQGDAGRPEISPTTTQSWTLPDSSESNHEAAPGQGTSRVKMEWHADSRGWQQVPVWTRSDS